MRPWQRWLAIGSGGFASLRGGASALAQDEGEGVVPVLRDVILITTGRVDAKLSTWVDGNALTEPKGRDFIEALASYIRDVVSYVSGVLWDLLVQLNYV